MLAGAGSARLGRAAKAASVAGWVRKTNKTMAKTPSRLLPMLDDESALCLASHSLDEKQLCKQRHNQGGGPCLRTSCIGCMAGLDEMRASGVALGVGTGIPGNPDETEGW